MNGALPGQALDDLGAGQRGEHGTGQRELRPAQAAAHDHRRRSRDRGVHEHRPAAGSPSGVIPPYSIPVSATATSIGANDALRTSRRRLTAP